jgi:hypothetical protein
MSFHSTKAHKICSLTFDISERPKQPNSPNFMAWIGLFIICYLVSMAWIGLFIICYLVFLSTKAHEVCSPTFDISERPKQLNSPNFMAWIGLFIICYLLSMAWIGLFINCYLVSMASNRVFINWYLVSTSLLSVLWLRWYNNETRGKSLRRQSPFYNNLEARTVPKIYLNPDTNSRIWVIHESWLWFATLSSVMTRLSSQPDIGSYLLRPICTPL